MPYTITYFNRFSPEGQELFQNSTAKFVKGAVPGRKAPANLEVPGALSEQAFRPASRLMSLLSPKDREDP